MDEPTGRADDSNPYSRPQGLGATGLHPGLKAYGPEGGATSGTDADASGLTAAGEGAKPSEAKTELIGFRLPEHERPGAGSKPDSPESAGSTVWRDPAEPEDPAGRDTVGRHRSGDTGEHDDTEEKP